MMRRVSLPSECFLTNLMPLKRKNCISLPLTPFSALSHHVHFQTKNINKSIVFFSNILVYNNCRPNTHLPNPTNGLSATAHAQLIFEKVLAPCIR